jgi:transcriptional regulator with XRE-family HTH domain
MNNFTEIEISKLQDNLLVIRKVAGWTTTELGNLIGVTKQTISNLENKKTTMTKTQYIAIRAILDYKISSNTDNIVLAQVVDILLNSDDIPEEEQEKVQNTMAFVSGAAEKGLSSTVIVAGMAALLGAIGYAMDGTRGAVLALTSSPKWLSKILKSDNDKKGGA